MVLEAVYGSLGEALANRMALYLGAWARPLSPLLLWQVKPRLGVDPGDLQPAESHAAHPCALIADRGRSGQARDARRDETDLRRRQGAEGALDHLWCRPRRFSSTGAGRI